MALRRYIKGATIDYGDHMYYTDIKSRFIEIMYSTTIIAALVLCTSIRW